MLDRWLATAKADAANGTVIADRVDRFVAISLTKGTAPQEPVRTLVVDKDGLHDGNSPARSVGDAKALIDANRNIAFARENANAISHGILVAGTRDASAASVRAAVIAAVAAGEQVWLPFPSKDAKITEPAARPITKELAQTGTRMPRSWPRSSRASSARATT